MELFFPYRDISLFELFFCYCFRSCAKFRQPKSKIFNVCFHRYPSSWLTGVAFLRGAVISSQSILHSNEIRILFDSTFMTAERANLGNTLGNKRTFDWMEMDFNSIIVAFFSIILFFANSSWCSSRALEQRFNRQFGRCLQKQPARIFDQRSCHAWINLKLTDPFLH